MPKRNLAVSHPSRARIAMLPERDGKQPPFDKTKNIFNSLPHEISEWGPILDAPNDANLLERYVHPTYPKDAVLKRQTGRLLIGLSLKKGQIANLKLLSSSGHPLLDQAAVEAVYQWRFKQTFSGSFVQPFLFRLE
ncbi:MAG: energy transducer TonB [Deltaproteobacteria bacterium]|nr:energy transducer TonB [Deltaproteobacteria bacterium]